MSLLYNADGDKWDSTNNISVPLAGTMIEAVYLTNDTRRQTLCQYDGDGAGNGYLDCNWRGDLAGDYFFCERERGTGATSIVLQANAANYTHYGLNKWLWIVARWDTAGANADQSLWIGDESNNPAAPSAYTTQTVGSGAASTTAGSVTIGNSKVTTTRWIEGRVGFHALFPTKLSDADVNAICAGTYQNSPLVWWLPGANGVIDVPDTVAGNLGIITGLSSPDTEPARYFSAGLPPFRGRVMGAARLR